MKYADMKKLNSNENVIVNDNWRGKTRGRQGTVVKVTNRNKGLIRVKFPNIVKSTEYHYTYLDLVPEEIKTVERNEIDSTHLDNKDETTNTEVNSGS